MKKGLFDGVVSCKNTKGKKIAEVTYSEGHQDGAFKVWAPDTDNLMLSMTVRSGFPNGMMERYNPKSGKIISRIAYTAGKKTGEEKLWDITGETVLTDLIWSNGAKTGVYRYGDSEEHYKAGVLDGIWRSCPLNFSLPWEKRQPNYDKAQAYRAMADSLGGTYFLPALVDNPSGVECTEKIYKEGIEQKAAQKTESGALQTACLDGKVAAFRKEYGLDAVIVNDVIEEWTGECTK